MIKDNVNIWQLYVSRFFVCAGMVVWVITAIGGVLGFIRAWLESSSFLPSVGFFISGLVMMLLYYLFFYAPLLYSTKKAIESFGK